jgi:hypothetical protein
VKVNCAYYGDYCRSRKIKHFPTVEVHLPDPGPDAAFSQKMRFRLLKGPGNYAVSPFRSDFSIEGFRGALQELGLAPAPDPFADTKAQLQMQISDAYSAQILENQHKKSI